MAHYNRSNNCTCGAAADQTYNGWSNYETWVVNLWLSNDQGTYEYVRDLVKDSKADYNAVEALREWIEEVNPLLDEASLFTDLLNAALSEVDWWEIVEHFRQD